MVSVFVIVKVFKIELKAACTRISNSAQAKRAGRYAERNPASPVPSKVAKSAKPGRPKTSHRIDQEN